MSFCNVTIIGNLGAAPETKTLDSGKTVTRLSVATSHTWKDQSGEKHKDTEWHNCILWGKIGLTAAEYLSKGDKVHLEGRIKSRKYEDKRYTDIVINKMTLLGGRSNREANFPAEDSSDSLNPVAVPPGPFPTAVADPPKAVTSDDLPF